MNKNQVQLLNTLAFIFLGIAVLAMIIRYIMSPSYQINNREMQGTALEISKQVQPSELNQLMLSGELSNHLLVDLRNEQDFAKGSLPDAINVPFETLLEKPILKKLKGNKPILLFGDRESVAAGAAMLLAGQGIHNVRIISNDFEFVRNQVLNNYHPKNAETHTEKAMFDYPRFLKTTPGNSKSQAAQPKIPTGKMAGGMGGC